MLKSLSLLIQLMNMEKSLKISSFEEYQAKYKESIENPEKFWAEIAEQFVWRKKWDKVLDFDFKTPKVEWFKGAKLNITENALDRHVANNPNKTAVIWEPNDPSDKEIRYTYKELLEKVCQLSNLLRSMGVKKGDRVCIYMPMIPEFLIATLACARIGAVHSIVFAGFSAQSLADRINDAKAKLVLTTDGMRRGAKELMLKPIVDEALNNANSVEKVLVLNTMNTFVEMKDNRDFWWNVIINDQETFIEPEIMDAEDLLYILYTSGSTGKPKGVVHTCGGYMVGTAYTFQNVFQPDVDDLFWCTADIGWVTGHSYIAYGPLISGNTILMFEGIPTYPDASRFWQIVDKYQVNQLLTAPTAIRSLMAFGTEIIEPFNLSSLKVLGSVGEPINEEAWKWYYKNIGREKCPIVDNWWQTETGAIMISGLGNISPMKPSFAGYPLPGILPVLLNQEGKEITEHDTEGYLCFKTPWPSMFRTTYGDHERYKQTYFSNYQGYYFSGDGAKKDENGMFRIIGRVDDVINVSGHRFGTAEIENAINTNDKVIESAVVAYPHEVKGQAIYAFVICDTQTFSETLLKNQIIGTVSEVIGKFAIPEKIQIVSGLPKTRSGKIMRRILRKIAEGELDQLGDVTTLLDPSIIDGIITNRI